jgi:hypothetical protein
VSYKTFIDDDGTPWQVWDVRPEETEQRLRERRLIHDPPHDERRGVVDRRTGREVRADLPPELRDGWLVFQSAFGRRRHWPIPVDWDRLPLAELRTLCRQAKDVVRGRSSSSGDGSVEPGSGPVTLG